MGEEVVVLLGIKEIYISIPKNRLSVTIVECISVDRKAIPLIIIIPSIIIIASWFSNNIASHKLITILESRYINKGIYIV